ncbi:MAG: D-alanine--D-alanine ligase [Pontiellaceae bacterium]|nr:D-alanine--D-alanine ligase [Pontiellaceae bacterium]
MPIHKPTIAVVCGGPSAEAEVSRVSGKCVADALKATYPDTVLLELDGNIAAELNKHDVDVVFPVLHGPPGEDGTFQGFLETLGYPYVGCGVRASACAMDKTLAKHLFRDADLPVARDIVVHRHEGVQTAVERIVEKLGSDVVVKPSSQGSALGVIFPRDTARLEAALETTFADDEQVLVEERIIGREITVGLLERVGLEVLPVVEISTPRDAWYDYEHRYTPGLSEHIVPADLPMAQYQRVKENARMAHAALGCRDLSRADFIVPDDGKPVLLEVNTLPGMTPTSLYPDAAKAAGIPFDALVVGLIERALLRGRN